MSDLVRFVFSVSGMVSALVFGCAWLLARPSSTTARRFVALVVFAYAIASFYPLTHAAAALVSRGYHPLTSADVPRGRTAVVVLGSGSFSARDWNEHGVAIPDPVGANRAVEAVRVFRLVDPVVIVSSGGSVGTMDPNAPGGKVMGDLLLQLGVPPTRLMLEIESQTTHDEAVIVKRMLEPLRLEQVVIVTSDIHMRRALGTFRAEGLPVVPAIARSPHVPPPWDIVFLPSQSGLTETQDVMHEVLGIGYYAAHGWFR